MATIREWLGKEGFDWENGRILYQDTGRYSPGWNDRIGDGEFIAQDHPILDKEFDSWYGSPECPRFIAEDAEKIYFPVQYDGSTWIEFVYRDVERYVEEDTPYPGA